MWFSLVEPINQVTSHEWHRDCCIGVDLYALAFAYIRIDRMLIHITILIELSLKYVRITKDPCPDCQNPN